MKTLILILLVSSYSQTFAKPVHFTSNENKVNMIELYSSEGCSSCPPADKWLASLKKHPRLWKDFIAVEFHVDYWNRLGWLDPFSHKKFTQRQRTYASEWVQGRVYTPGFVLNGKEWKLGTQKAPTPNPAKVGILSAKQLGKNNFEIHFRPTQNKVRPYHIVTAVLGNGLETDVKYGENAGSKLRHEFVVLGMNKVSMKNKSDSYLAKIALPKTKSVKAKSYSLVFWVTDGKSLKPIQSIGGPWDQKL